MRQLRALIPPKRTLQASFLIAVSYPRVGGLSVVTLRRSSDLRADVIPASWDAVDEISSGI